MDWSKFDFADFGCHDFAGSRAFAGMFGGSKFVGFDTDRDLVIKNSQQGYDCIQWDVSQPFDEYPGCCGSVPIPAKCVRYVMMSHILEHLENIYAVRGAIKNAVYMAQDFIIITGPSFDAALPLAKLGLKSIWHNCSDHKMHLTTEQLAWCLILEGLNDFVIWNGPTYNGVDDTELHSLASPSGCDYFDKGTFPSKSHLKKNNGLVRAIPRWFTCIAYLTDTDREKHKAMYEKLKQSVKVCWKG